MMGSLYPNPYDVDEVLRRTGLTEVAGQKADHLSGGQSQRVRFAVALVSRPQLLVLDEPTVSLDVEGRHEFWQTVRGIAAGGTTVVFATHYLEEADAFADRIVLMARGRLVADGPATEIKAVVGRRTIRATLPAVPLEDLRALPGVAVGRATRRGGRAHLRELRPGHPRPARRVPAGARPGDRRGRPRGGLPAAHRRRRRPGRLR